MRRGLTRTDAATLLRVAPALLVLLVLAIAVWPSAALAERYTVYACQTPDGMRAPADGWTAEADGVNLDAANRCPSGSLSATAGTDSVHAQASTLSLTFRAPANTQISSWDVRRAVRVSAGPDWAWNYTAFVNVVDFSSGHWPEQCWPGEGCTTRTATKPWTGAGPASAIVLFIDCSSGPPGPCQPGGVANLSVESAAVVLEDRADPVLTSPPTGTAVEVARRLSGVVGLSFSATDAGGGVARAVLDVDGTVVAEQAVGGDGCRPPYTAVVPCKPSAGGTLHWDTRSVPNGIHQVSLRVYDATGINHVTAGPFDITVANRGDSACRPEALTVEAGWRGRARRTVSFGRPWVLRGRVSHAGGGPAPGVQVGLVDARTGDRVGTATTDPHGRYRVRARSTRSRRLRATVQTASGVLACSRPLTLQVRAGVRLAARPHALRNGQRVRLSGRVRGGAIPRDGKLIVLQALAGKRWKTFDELRTGKRGRFTTSYRFRRTFSARTYRLRVRAPAESGFPFAAGASRSVRVKVWP